MKFRIGDKVGYIGDDKPHILEKSPGKTYPLCFDNGNSFTTEGIRVVGDAHPSIWLWDTGAPPYTGERDTVVYPIIKKDEELIVKYTGLDSFVVLKTKGGSAFITGHSYDCTVPHTDPIWTDCTWPVVKYPYCMRLTTNTDLVVEVIAHKKIKVLSVSKNQLWVVGAILDEDTTDTFWEPCDYPVWKPTKPTWCRVWDDDMQEDNCDMRLVLSYDEKEKAYLVDGSYGSVYYDIAKPINYDEIQKRFNWQRKWM